MSWMPCGRSVYPCRAHPNVIRPMRVHSPYIVKSIKMVPSCLIFPLQFECSKISSTSTFNQKKNLQRSTMHFTQKSCMYATQELHPQFPSHTGLFCLVHHIFSKLILSLSLSLSLSLQPYQFQVSNNFMNHSEFIFIGGINYSHIPLYNFLISGDYNN